MRNLKETYGPWALITGASSGIGAEFAQQLASKRMNLVLVARRQQRLDELAERLMHEYHVDVKVVCADLSKPDFMPSILSITDQLEIGLLINCAGFSITGAFLHNDIQRELDMLHVNCRAPMLLAHSFGKRMSERKRGGIVFVSSSVAFGSVPYWTNYAATKSHNALLGEGLSYELKSEGIDVLTVCPGGTKTEFQEIAGIQDIGAMSAASVVTAALRNLGRRSLVIPGWHNRFIYQGVNRVMPRRWRLRLFASLVRKLSTMEGR